MNPNWIIVDLDQRVYLDIACAHDTSPLQKAEIPLGALRVPCTDELLNGMLQGHVLSQRQAPLFRLPPELLHDILDMVNPRDGYVAVVFIFALVCKLALAVARPHIVRLQQRHFSPLAGHRLINVVHTASTLSGTYPERTSMDNEMRTLFVSDSIGTESGEAAGASLYGLAKSWRRYVHDPRSLTAATDLLYRPSAVSRMSMDDFRRFRALSTPHYPECTPWVLCNLSKREYIRADAAAPRSFGNNDQCTQRMGVAKWEHQLAHLLLTCICWPPISGTAFGRRGTELEDAQKVDFGRGLWAGDRIEMTTVERICAQSEGGEPWTDVTADVLRAHCMKSELSKDLALYAPFGTL
ncbi:hypothetical protein BN946_scf185014.g97 [Trametes cinnabarina]|uniref:F-box domain-containing protein n=1 Tax=Pycnoporus cinnabarinus TaxID=5643 RepID=A0A060SGI0_PYCCI|nr:hypothetical protein BN946_scf185014.g97 [Trametes cinnabarina]